jgi:hypothetical protein
MLALWAGHAVALADEWEISDRARVVPDMLTGAVLPAAMRCP